MEWISDPQAWIAFLTLAGLEIVLGIDNIVFISILVGKLPSAQQASAYKIGLALAMVMRILLLLSLSWIMGLTEPLFTIPITGNEVSGRDLVLIVGGLFLVAKSTMEIHEKLEGHEGEKSGRAAGLVPDAGRRRDRRRRLPPPGGRAGLVGDDEHPALKPGSTRPRRRGPPFVPAPAREGRSSGSSGTIPTVEGRPLGARPCTGSPTPRSGSHS